jgi:hypothetical protein
MAAEPTPITARLEAGARAQADAAIEVANRWSRLAVGYEVKSREHYAVAAEDLHTVKGHLNDLHDHRMSLTRPLDTAKKGIIALFAPAEERLRAAEVAIKDAMTGFLAATEEAAKARNALLQAAAEQEGFGFAPLVYEEPVTADGIQRRATYSAQVDDFPALVKAAAEDPRLLSCLKPDLVRLNEIARSQHEAMAIPGVRAVRSESIAARVG